MKYRCVVVVNVVVVIVVVVDILYLQHVISYQKYVIKSSTKK